VLESRRADGAPIRPLVFTSTATEPNEPPHIHVDRDDPSGKFWLDPVQLAGNFGFRAHELRAIQSIVEEHEKKFLEAWNEFFGVHG
jgi:hypothetical protein